MLAQDAGARGPLVQVALLQRRGANLITKAVRAEALPHGDLATVVAVVVVKVVAAAPRWQPNLLAKLKLPIPRVVCRRNGQWTTFVRCLRSRILKSTAR